MPSSTFSSLQFAPLSFGGTAATLWNKYDTILLRRQRTDLTPKNGTSSYVRLATNVKGEGTW
jgi:hypothetical protein